MPSPTTDFTVFDGQELVTYDAASASPVANVPALRRPLSQSRMRNVENFMALQATDVVFHLQASPLAAITLSAGDVITDAGSATYQVLFVERQTLNNAIAVVCRPT